MQQAATNPTGRNQHKLYLGDSRDLSFLPDQSVHLAITSPPYWTLKKYSNGEAQLGNIQDYEEFVSQLSRVWSEVYRILVPGGRLVCVVGDVCVSRRSFGRHVVFPLHSDIAVACRKIGFDNLNPIIWYKIASASYEVSGNSSFLGKPYEPNAIIKNDIEFILMERKPGGYRKPTEEQRNKSRLTKPEFAEWFRQIWDVKGEIKRDHPAPFPVEIAYRLVRMFSFWGDTVIDPFCGTGSTMLASAQCGRNSIGVEVDPTYCDIASRRMREEGMSLLDENEFSFEVADQSSRRS
jgi:site-specific DNA-methyltransferase (adenine-specific)